MEAKDNGSSFLSMLKDDPSSTMALLGSVRSLLNQPLELAQAQAQIAQTQWSPYVGGGPGNPFAVDRSNPLDAAIQGYTAGMIKEDADKRNEELLKALRGDDSPYKASVNTVDASRQPNSVSQVEPELSPYVQRPTTTEETYVYNNRDLDNGKDIVNNMFSAAMKPGNYNMANPMTSEQFRRLQAIKASPYSKR